MLALEVMVVDNWNNSPMVQRWLKGVGRCWNDLVEASPVDFKTSGCKFGEANLVVK